MNWYKVAGALFGLIVLALIVMKFAGTIAWPWWIVTAPLWVPVVLMVLTIIVGIAFFADAESKGKNPFM